MNKIGAIADSGKPENKGKTRSFLDIRGYIDIFIPKYAEITASFMGLTKKKGQFQWGKEHESSFKKLKAVVSKATNLSYFHSNKQTILSTGASFNERIAAGVFQISKDEIRPVHFISGALSEIEVMAKEKRML